jgi:hypothetical protein
MQSPLGTDKNFRSLSLADLLRARDLYHFHLMNKANVVGTAVGLYLIRLSDPDPPSRSASDGHTKAKPTVKTERTFANSGVRDYSWPCVLVLVKEWEELSKFGGGRDQLHPEEAVPRTLYLPDGRMVPVCVVKVEPAAPAPDALPDWHWPDGLFGGGMPIAVEPQGRRHIATAGCLVTDGHTTYVLTSRHVCGAADEPAYVMAGTRRKRIGRASDRQLTRAPFREVYPQFRARQTYVNLDVGLIELTDVNDWTSQVFGLKPIGPLADLNELNITLRLIDAPVVASGAASGRLEGRIKALFYRYKSVGGYDYVADFLIAPAALDAHGGGATQTQPGDSGAIWHLVEDQADDQAKGKQHDSATDPLLRPLAVEWGGQVFMGGSDATRFAFALATNLTSVFRALDVELVVDHNTGYQPYWGQTGHYGIATFACTALAAGRLRTFMEANLDNITFATTDLTAKQIAARLKKARDEHRLVPLADVPDLVWKQHQSKVQGGRDTKWIHQGPRVTSTGPEHPTHYADIDEQRAADHKTLRQLSLADPANLSVAFWQQFYTAAGHTDPTKRGLLPFRVWQFFDAMVDFASKKKPEKFLCAAGIVSHYVGDACQPLHGSVLADGHPDGTGKGVHSLYESKMIDRYAPKIVAALPAAIAKLDAHGEAVGEIQTGKDAALEVVRLMDRTARTIKPEALVGAYVDAGGEPTAAVRDALWEKFGDETVTVMADGARVLARVWEAAWKVGKGQQVPAASLTAIDPGVLQSLYTDKTFVPSLDLDHVAAVLQ